MNPIQLGALILIAYFAVGCFTAGGMFGNSSSAPDPDHIVIVVVFWPIILALYVCVGIFAAGAWVAGKFTA